MSHELATQATRRMRQHKYSEAIELFEAHLSTWPDDLVALMQLGICHLLNRSEQVFVAIHTQVSRKLDILDDLPAEVASLWGTYNRLMRNVGASALVIGATAGCAEPKKDVVPEEASNKTEEVLPKAEEGQAPDEAMSMHRYSGGVYQGDDLLQGDDLQIPLDEVDPNDETNKKKPKDKEATSMHRYSGGVFLEPREVPKNK
ncbi:MAG: hypothetical protein HN348_03045 [Proteobacteria bacterium]|jgi:hypothetical protein|nr:hypothetical protein [Pseudomonadota bacterium]